MCPHCGNEIPQSFRYCGYCGRCIAEAKGDAALRQQAETQTLSRDERRDITVLFCDVSGFTSLCERLDAEEVHAVMNECFTGLGRAIQEHGGFVDRYLGDALLALFGAPIAHEDDPVRACFAALAMNTFLAAFSEQHRSRTGMDLQMRIGVHCGIVVAGGVGSQARLVYGARGDTMNTAARLQSAAQPGAILVSREVVKRTRSMFEFTLPQRFVLKGKVQPVDACQLLRKTEERREGSDEWAVVRLVGRETELHQLAQHVRAPHPFCRWTEVVGEQGIGKTRLVQGAVHMVPGSRLLLVTADPDTRIQPFWAGAGYPS